MPPNFKKNKFSSGFTLIELLIVIAILAILATVTLLVINPAQMIKQSRDANRIAELNQIDKALSLYLIYNGSSSGMGTVTKVYVSLPSAQADCSDLGLPALGGGYTYVCKPSTTYRNVDGTGWIPVDLTSISASAGSLFSALPIDPINTVANDYYYTYIPGSWALAASMESTKYIAANAANDGGQLSTRYEIGNEIVLNANLDFCPTSVSYQGKIYNTVAINDQCWFAENLDYDNGCSSVTWVNSTDVGWCGYYTGGPFANEGLLYQWSAAMNGSTTAGAQGLCPTGWHVPTDTEWITLEEFQGMCTGISAGCSGATGWRGTNEGGELKEAGTTHWEVGVCGGTCNTSGFTGLSTGARLTNGSLGYRLNSTQIWSSVESDIDNAWERNLGSNLTTIYRNIYSKAYGFSVRCLKD